MLSLSRKIGETILIGDNVEVTVVEINGSYVTLAFKAPEEVIILREELLENSE